MGKYDVYAGVDVGKSFHWLRAIGPDEEVIVSGRVPQDEKRLDEAFARLGEGGKSVLVVVDQPKNIGALTLACARRAGCDTMFLPGLAMRRAAGLLPGDAKTDERDAMVISMTALTVPKALRPVPAPDPRRAEMDALVAWDADCVQDRTRQKNRLRALLAECNPMFEAVLGDELDRPFVLALLARFGGPWGMRAAGQKSVRAWAGKHKRVPRNLLDALIGAAWDMDGKPLGADVVERGPVKACCARIAELTETREHISSRVEALLADDETFRMLTTIPGVGVHTAAALVSMVDVTMFKDCDHLASYAGIAPRTRQSGTSVKGETAARCGNKALKNALYLSAFASLRQDPDSRAYYDAKRAAGKKHNTALISLARRRLKIMFAIMRDKTPYHRPGG